MINSSSQSPVWEISLKSLCCEFALTYQPKPGRLISRKTNTDNMDCCSEIVQSKLMVHHNKHNLPSYDSTLI